MILESITESRILVEAELEPMQGQRFQPTGFADLGAATYTLPSGTRMLLVESAQSMANRLEATIVDADGEVIPELEGISYVTSTLTKPEGDTVVVSTMTEAHRLASPFIISNKDFCNKFCLNSVNFKACHQVWHYHGIVFCATDNSDCLVQI